jgi:N-acetylglutamate synthase-like GNAT family acetyltransferase
MGCGEACPVVPGLRRLDWPLEDPMGKPLETVRRIRDEIRERVAALIGGEGCGRAAITIEPASAADVDTVRALLVQVALPNTGLADQFPAAYSVARDGAELVGAAGLEVYGATGLLRSVAVAPALQRRGVARTLIAERLAVARASGLDTVYLLTTTAADYFRRFGFTPASRAGVPPLLAASPELVSACPASAACMRLSLRR